MPARKRILPITVHIVRFVSWISRGDWRRIVNYSFLYDKVLTAIGTGGIIYVNTRGSVVHSFMLAVHHEIIPIFLATRLSPSGAFSGISGMVTFQPKEYLKSGRSGS